LKALPWRHASEFINGNSTADVFDDYGAAKGSGHAVLKAKYAANQAAIAANWNELAEWVAQQKAAGL
jgi:hypothetical protein